VTATTGPARAPGFLAAATGTPARALTLVGLAGGGIALQAYLNGRLSGTLGSVEVASAANNAVGFVALLALAAASGSLRRAVAVGRSGRRPRAWMLTGGMLGALLVIASTAAAPKVGVALLTVALVCGQTGGSLPVDAFGISPAGHHRLTLPRLLGAGLAVVAVVVSALGAHGDLHVGLLAFALVAGVGGALQQAVNGRLAAVTGEPGVAALVNFIVGFLAMGLLALAVTWGDTVHWGGPAWEWLGGLGGASYVLVSAAAVRTLGVLRLMLVSVAGQSAGALIIDLIAPVRGESVAVTTVIGLLLTVVAVFVSGRAREQAAAH
jgi:bacterial/archaeal transporter family-2 protein